MINLEFSEQIHMWYLPMMLGYL